MNTNENNNKTLWTILIIVIVLAVSMGIYYLVKPKQNSTQIKATSTPISTSTSPNALISTDMTESLAVQVAKNDATCSEAGDIDNVATFNGSSKTWWVNILNSNKKGCSPACVISIETKTVEINWRCTGLSQ